MFARTAGATGPNAHDATHAHMALTALHYYCACPAVRAYTLKLRCARHTGCAPQRPNSLPTHGALNTPFPTYPPVWRDYHPFCSRVHGLRCCCSASLSRVRLPHSWDGLTSWRVLLLFTFLFSLPFPTFPHLITDWPSSQFAHACLTFAWLLNHLLQFCQRTYPTGTNFLAHCRTRLYHRRFATPLRCCFLHLKLVAYVAVRRLLSLLVGYFAFSHTISLLYAQHRVPCASTVPQT